MKGPKKSTLCKWGAIDVVDGNELTKRYPLRDDGSLKHKFKRQPKRRLKHPPDPSSNCDCFAFKKKKCSSNEQISSNDHSTGQLFFIDVKPLLQSKPSNTENSSLQQISQSQSDTGPPNDENDFFYDEITCSFNETELNSDFFSSDTPFFGPTDENEENMVQ